MKKILTTVTAVAAIAAASFAFSANLPNDGYVTKQGPITEKSSTKSNKLAGAYQPPTDVVIQNKKYNYVTMHIEGTNVYDHIVYFDEDRITNDAVKYPFITITASDGRIVFSQSVCPRAIIKLDPNYPNPLLDTILC